MGVGAIAVPLLALCLAAAAHYDPLRSVTDVHGALWQEFFDEQSTSFYYFNPATGETQWTIDFADLGALPEEPRGAASAAESSPAEAEAEAAGLGQCETGAEHPECSADYAEQQPQSSEFVDESVLDALFPVRKARRISREDPDVLPVFEPPVHDRLVQRFADPAGGIRFEGFEIALDEMEGIQARRTFSARLKPPIAFTYMFIQLGGVEAERARVETQLMTNGTEPDLWEMLGHIWRQYGDVYRAIDCYRKAIYLGSVSKATLYLALAGLLDQMNFVDDALIVLNVFLDSQDPTTIEAEINFSWAYFMSSQLYVRKKQYLAAGLMLDAAVYRQVQFAELSEPLRCAFLYKRESFGGPPMLFGAAGINDPFKDPWLFVRSWHTFLGLLGEPGRAATEWLERIGEEYPHTCLMLRKFMNAALCVLGGYMSHRASEIADVLRGWGVTVAPGWLSLTLCLLLFCFQAVCTEFSELQIVPLMFLGHVWGIPIRKEGDEAEKHLEQQHGESELSSTDDETAHSSPPRAVRR